MNKVNGRHLDSSRIDEGRKSSIRLSFVVCVSDVTILTENLLRSPCLRPGSVHQIILVNDCPNAAEGFNRGMNLASGDILVFVHQDVFLPAGWDESFIAGFVGARSLLPAEVVGVYGLSAPTEDGRTRRLGCVNDRGEWLRGSGPLPARAQSLDELLIAVPRGSRLRPDPELGFDLYATDLVLQAESRGGCGAVVEAPCEHRSSLQRTQIPRPIIDRFLKAAVIFERKWAARFPIETPCIRFDATCSAAVRVEEIYRQINRDKSG